MMPESEHSSLAFKSIIAGSVAVAGAAFTFMCIVVGMTVLRFPTGAIGQNLKAITFQTQADLAQGGLVIDKAGTVLDVVARPCQTKANGKVVPCGTLENINETLHTFRGAAGQVEVAARHENKNLTTLDGQERQLFKDVNATMKSANQTTREIGATAKRLDVLVSKTEPRLDDLIEQSTIDLRDIHTITSNPDIPVIVHHAVDITASGDLFAKDSADKLHSYVHPTKKQGFRAGADATMLWIHSRLVPPLF